MTLIYRKTLHVKKKLYIQPEVGCSSLPATNSLIMHLHGIGVSLKITLKKIYLFIYLHRFPGVYAIFFLKYI